MGKQKSAIKEEKKDIKDLDLNKENIDSYKSCLIQDEYERRALATDEGEVILINLNFFWTYKEMNKIRVMWNNGVDFRNIVKSYEKSNWNTKRKEEEIFLLLLHLAREGKIKKRTGFLWGNEE